jgi:hypothetical protein
MDHYDANTDDAEAMELGRCKQLLGEEFYLPVHR